MDMRKIKYSITDKYVDNNLCSMLILEAERILKEDGMEIIRVGQKEIVASLPAKEMKNETLKIARMVREYYPNDNVEDILLLEDAAKKEGRKQESRKCTCNGVDAVNDYLNELPIRYSKTIYEYLIKRNRLIPSFVDLKSVDAFLNQAILISIDIGYGYSTFLKAIEYIYCHHGVLQKKDKEVLTKEFKIHTENDWSALFHSVEEMNAKNVEKKQKYILGIDISECLKGEQQALRNYLKRLSDINDSCVIIFRIPYLEKNAFNKIKVVVADIFSIDSICVPPIKMQDMVDYIKTTLNKSGYVMKSSNLDCLLEKLILKEKQDGNFWGFRTLKKLVNQLIYSKAEENARLGVYGKTITITTITACLKQKPVEDEIGSLEDMIGMEKIKEQFKQIIAQIKYLKIAKEEGKNVEAPSIHMAFLGSPGTGKTTAARIFAQMMKQEGILSKGLLYEYNAQELCGQYVGHSAPKTSAICHDAYGSVLFIDEAYSLCEENVSGNKFGNEVVATLITEMENHRDDFCVIFAGYDDEMENFLKTNPGLESRVPHKISFANYTREELVQIMKGMLDKVFEYDAEILDATRDFLDSLDDSFLKSKEFSNARYIRNLYEKMWGKAAYRAEMNGDEKLIITKTDFELVIEEERKKIKKEQGKKIGF